MSPVGHSIVGLAFAVVAMPRDVGRKWLVTLPVAFISLASLPDWPMPSWGHDRYDISHSIFVNISLVSMVILLWCVVPSFRSAVGARCLCLGAGAWLSHLLLDSFYNHGRGVPIYWPYSDARLNFAMPWFNTIDLSQSIASSHNLSVYFVEFVAYLPVLIMAVGFRKLITRQPVVSPHENAE